MLGPAKQLWEWMATEPESRPRACPPPSLQLLSPVLLSKRRGLKINPQLLTLWASVAPTTLSLD